MKLKNFICYQGVLLGECMTFNQGVAGSNPAGLTTSFTESVEKPSQTIEILSPKSSD